MNARGRTKLVVGLGVLLIGWVGAVGMAQEKGSPAVTATPVALTVGNKRYDASKELVRLAKRYSLTEAQKAKIEPLLLEQQKQVHALGEDTSLSDMAWAAGVRKVHAQTVAKVKRELTDEQASKYAKDEAKWAKSSQNDASSDDEDDGPPPDGPPPGGGPGGPGGGPGGPGGGGPPGE